MDVNEMIGRVERGELAPVPLPPEIASYEDEQDPEVRGDWTITTTTQADWALRRLGECETELAEVDAMEQAAIAEIQQRCERLRAKANHGVGYFKFKLLDFMERHRDAIVRGASKSRAFVYGRLGWRKHPERLVVTDKAALTSWLEALPRESPLARWKVEPALDAIQRHFQATGEIPPGMDVKPETEDPQIKAEPLTSALAKGRK